MLKNISNLGQSLSKKELSNITGSGLSSSRKMKCNNSTCPPGQCCTRSGVCEVALPGGRNCR